MSIIQGTSLERHSGGYVVNLVKICLVVLLLIFATPGWSGNEAPDVSSGDSLEFENEVWGGLDEAPINWVDNSHIYATEQAQALTEWMDNFFGDPNYDLESAESLVRLVWKNDIDQSDGYNTKLRVSGKLQLPRISKRLNLFFGGEDGHQLSNDEQKSEDNAGLLYTVDQRKRSRVDLVLGVSSMGLKPGVRFRHQRPLYEHSSYRYTQQVEYKDNKGFFTTGELNLDNALNDTNLLRFSNELVYGEKTEGTEWQSSLVLYQRRSVHKKDPRVFAYFGSVNGVTDPSYVKNYRLGVLFRRQIYRPFLFVEMQPSYNWRKRHNDDVRRGSWSIQFNFEVALERDLRRKEPAQDSDPEELPAPQSREQGYQDYSR